MSSQKIGVIERLLEKVDVLLLGGGMAYTFVKALGYEVGNSIVEESMIGEASDVMRIARRRSASGASRRFCSGSGS